VRSTGLCWRQGEAKTVVVDPQVGYFGTPLSMDSLVTA
jgi:hypothetical protein